LFADWQSAVRLVDGGILTRFSDRPVRYFLYIGISLFGLAYELLKSEFVRWPLIAGYALIIGACVYALMRHARETATEDE
jgi:hypothetical protein